MDHAEHGLSHWVDAFLDRALIGPCWFTAIEGGIWRKDATTQQRIDAENKRRARGIKPSHLDWYAWQLVTGIYAQWELKVAGRPTRPGQDQTMVLLERNKIPTGVFETVPQVCEFMLRSGFEMHGNARNIADEYHERYLANRREHVTATKPKRAPRKTVPGRMASVAFGHRNVWKV